MTEAMHREFEDDMFASVNHNATAAQEAQERRRADKLSRAARYTANLKKREAAVALAATAVFLTALASAYAHEVVGAAFFALALEAALICLGWCLNNTVRAFRRKSHTARKG